MPQGNSLRLSDDKAFCMKEMTRSMQNAMAETAWPKVQYLWKLHPIFGWVNDKAGLLYGRAEAPIVGLSGGLAPSETIFVVTGSIPNKKSTPLVDEWFGLLYREGKFSGSLSMSEVIKKTGFRRMDIPNTNVLTEKETVEATALLPDVVNHAKDYLHVFFKQYEERMIPLIDEEVLKLGDLEERHKSAQISMFESERKRSEQERIIDELFSKFIDWVKDTLTIQDNPYIRIAAVMKGVAK